MNLDKTKLCYSSYPPIPTWMCPHEHKLSPVEIYPKLTIFTGIAIGIAIIALLIINL